MADNGNGEKVNTNIVTLTRFLNEEQTKHKEASGDFTYVFAPVKVSLPTTGRGRGLIC
jgi:hypothetical protein